MEMEYTSEIKKIMSLVAHNKILTWDNLLKRGYQGPSISALCKKYSKDVDHIFLSYPYVFLVCSGVLQSIKIHADWNMNSIERCLSLWFEEYKTYHSLSFYILWGIWWSRNANIFDQIVPYIRGTYLNIFVYFLEIGPKKEKRPWRHIQYKEVWSHYLVVFFDGASSNRVCGHGDFLILKVGSSFHFSWNSGSWRNNRVELITLWGALLCDKWLVIEDLVVFGDSKVILDWVQHRSTFGPPSLTLWMQQIRTLIISFHRLSINHVYIEQHQVANILSKSRCNNLPRMIFYLDFDSITLFSSESISISWTAHDTSWRTCHVLFCLN